MIKKTLYKYIAFAMCLTMTVLALTACNNSGLYSANEVTSTLSIADDVKSFYDAVDMEYAYDLTYELAYNWDELAEPLGWRTAGSESEHKTAEYLAKEMAKIGLQDVEKLATTCDKFQNNGTSLKIKDTDVVFNGGSQEDVEAETNGPAPYQVNGTNGDLTAEIVDVKNGYEKDYKGKDVEGKIVLAKVDQANGYWIDSYMHEAKNHGAAAIVTWANSGYGEVGTYTTNVQDVCCGDVIPSVAISANQAKRIKSAIKNGHDECTLNIDTEMVPRGGKTYNVCGRIPGKNHNEKIIIAGHYDKYWYGFQDDCAAIGLVLAVGKAMIDSGYEPEYDIYFVCHGAEEWGVSDAIFDWAGGSWGMVNEHNMADNVRTMINSELPAYKLDKALSIQTVPENKDVVNSMFDSGLIITSGEVQFNKDATLVSTHEDGICYREYGAPYFINHLGGDSFLSERYHTQADNKETYDEDTFRTNINWAGAYAIYADKEPAIELNIAKSAEMLEEYFNKEYAEEAGVDADAYLSAVKEMKEAGQALYEKAVACNEKYEQALADGDNSKITAAKDEAEKLNKINLDAFQQINEQLLEVSDGYAIYGHPTYNSNVKLLDGVVAGLKDGIVWNDDETGAGDYAWQLNNELEYTYMEFGMKTADREMDVYSASHYADKNHAQWGWNHLYEAAKTGAASYELLRAETIDDIKDVDAMIKVYQNARKAQLSLIKSSSEKELTQILKITKSLK